MWDKNFIAEYAELINYETASPCLCSVAVKLRRVKSAGESLAGRNPFAYGQEPI